jgi:L-fuculose-phosphate aldolase
MTECSVDEARKNLIAHARQMNAVGLNRGTAGNLSVRLEGNGFLITPTGMRYDRLATDDIVAMTDAGVAHGRRLPSSEWRFHRDLYRARADAGAILHAHSPFATSLACLRRDIPAFHYMITRFGGGDVRCAAYATFGTQQLSAAVLTAMLDRRACLLANHGMLVVGKDLPQALALGVELETLCEQYWRACQLGQPVLLDAAEMKRVLEKFAGYGQQS